MSARRPPRGAALIARLLLPRRRAERLIADLSEEFSEHQLPSRGRIAATAWYWRQVVSSVWALRGAAHAGPSGRPRDGSLMASLAGDVRYGLRGLRRTPAFALSATVTLALGIGATTAIYSVVDAVLLRSLPYDQPDRIVRAWDNTTDGDVTDFSFRVVEYRQLRSSTDVFERVGAEFPISTTVRFADGDPQQVQGRMVTADFFQVFGVEPTMGRMFTDDEIAGGDRLLAVVTHGFWSRYLGADPHTVGGTLDVEGNRFTILGVLPDGYEHVSGSDAQIFIPYTIGTRGWIGHWFDLYARLQPGVSLQRATDEINAALAAVGDTDRASDRWFATVETLRDMVVGHVSRTIWTVFALVGVVLVLACVNVANLTLARSVSRLDEVAVRGSLGASRGRLMRQLLTENLLVAVIGGALGIGFAVVTLHVLLGIAPPSIPRVADTRIDLGVLAFAIAISAATSIVFGLGPALRTTRAGSAIARHARGATRDRAFQGLLGGLVTAQVALALPLLVTAGLTVRTVSRLYHRDLGFSRGQSLTFRVTVPRSRYPTAADVDAFYTRLRAGLSELPGVLAVGAGSDLPLSGEGAVSTITSRERLDAGIEQGVSALQRRATVGFFDALGTPVLDGREFDATDRAETEQVVILSESLARALFGEEDAVGRLVGWGSVPEQGDWTRVVGVVADVAYEEVERGRGPQIYQAHTQSTARDMATVIRTSGDPLALIEPARAVLRALDPALPAYSVGTLGGLVDVALAGRRFTMTLLGLFAALALALTVAGLYGVLTFVVGQRRREIGVRIALGASGPGVARMVLARGASFVAAGLGLGVAGVVAAGRLIEGLIYGVEPLDLPTLAAVTVVIVSVAAVACLAPARSASRVDPVEALRAG